MSTDVDRKMQEDDPEPTRKTAMIAAVVVLALVGCGLWLSHVLSASGKIEDCLMAGRRNCVPISSDLK